LFITEDNEFLLIKSADLKSVSVKFISKPLFFVKAGLLESFGVVWPSAIKAVVNASRHPTIKDFLIWVSLLAVNIYSDNGIWKKVIGN